MKKKYYKVDSYNVLQYENERFIDNVYCIEPKGGSFTLCYSDKYIANVLIPTKELKKSTIEDTLDLWKQNLSIYEIAKQRKLTPQTIYNHFTKLIQMEIVQLSDILPEDKISELKAAFKDFKGESLGELKEIHGDKFSWDELRLYKASLN